MQEITLFSHFLLVIREKNVTLPLKSIITQYESVSIPENDTDRLSRKSIIIPYKHLRDFNNYIRL